MISIEWHLHLHLFKLVPRFQNFRPKKKTWQKQKVMSILAFTHRFCSFTVTHQTRVWRCLFQFQANSPTCSLISRVLPDAGSRGISCINTYTWRWCTVFKRLSPVSSTHTMELSALSIGAFSSRFCSSRPKGLKMVYRSKVTLKAFKHTLKLIIIPA